MSFLLCFVACCVRSVWSSPVGMLNAMSTNQLEMVPLGQIVEGISVAKQDRHYNIHSVLVPKHNSIYNNSRTSKTFPCGDLQGDPLWRSAGNLTTDSCIDFKTVLSPLSQKNGFTLQFGSTPFDCWSEPTSAFAKIGEPHARKTTSSSPPSLLAPRVQMLLNSTLLA